jgi:hypothetical protein
MTFQTTSKYSGQTSLTIRPQDRRVLMLPAIDLGQGAILGLYAQTLSGARAEAWQSS